MQQQHEKLRKKRDGSYTTLPGYSPYDVIRPGAGFVSAPGSRLAYHPTASARSSSTLLSRSPRIQYRAATSHNIFPDPLFKEQWYLVSEVCKKFCFILSFFNLILTLSGCTWWANGENIFKGLILVLFLFGYNFSVHGVHTCVSMV